MKCNAYFSTLLLLVATATLTLSSTNATAETSAGQCQAHEGWFDSDGDRLPDIIESGVDTDNDGLPNYLDEDSDGDSIPDASEAYNSPALEHRDSDSDGIDDAYDVDTSSTFEDANFDGVADHTLPVDSDGDGIANYLDTDSDNDGLPDKDEIDSTSSFTDADTDADGLSDAEELVLGTAANKFDTDGGGVPDWWESYLGQNPLNPDDDHTSTENTDLDGDGLPNELEGFADTDLDQIPDYLDPDSDNDGWLDIIEAGLPDLDGDGKLDNTDDLNNNGIADVAESLVNGLPDSDADGIPNSKDLDSDNDGINDFTERQAADLLAEAGLQSLDIDGDGLPNHVDLDSDGDGLSDVFEIGFPDSNGDGITDLANDRDRDGIPDAVDADEAHLATNPADFNDVDADGIGDLFDTDQSLETTVFMNWVTLEQETVVLPNTDIDGDGIVDRHDTDHDGDGLVDQYFGLQIAPPGLTTDADGDGLVAFRDNDDTTPWFGEDEVPASVAAALAVTSVRPQRQSVNAVIATIPAYHRCQSETTDQSVSNNNEALLAGENPADIIIESGSEEISASNETPQVVVTSPVTPAPAAPTADEISPESDQPEIGAAKAGGSGAFGQLLLLLTSSCIFLRRRRSTDR